MNASSQLFSNVEAPLKRPLLKWAGGKTQLLRTILAAIPHDFSRYAELFFGGGALFWALARPGSLIADSNQELIEFYEVVRDNPEDLLAAVAKLAISREDYYRIRSHRPQGLSKLQRAGRLVYLNKTCFNGLYRVNRNGQFNTPFGGKTNVKLLDENDVLAASRLLKRTTILCADFGQSLSYLKEGDFVYLDPPYLPLGGHSDFRRYTREFFNQEHHVRLAIEFTKLRQRGIKALLSNSDTYRIRCLYKQHFCVRVMASRHINCNGKRRGKIPELLIANYPLEPTDVLS